MPVRHKDFPRLLSGFCTAMLLTCLAAAIGQAPQAPKKTTKQPPPPLALAQEANVLKAAAVLLAAADATYSGHKAKAIYQVEYAFSILEGSPKPSPPPRTSKKQAVAGSTGQAGDITDLGQLLSDALVYDAYLLLNDLATALTTNKQKSVLTHVKHAGKELAACLEQSAAQALKGKEATLLTQAYVLLAGTNGDFGGHRTAALKEVGAACNILNAGLLKQGTVQQKISALRNASAQNAAQSAAQDTAPGNPLQTASARQLLVADALIQRVASVLNPANQKRVLDHLANADREIASALKLR